MSRAPFLMVKRCEATWAIDEGLWASMTGRDQPPFPFSNQIHTAIRCEEPLGHRERGHHGSVFDEGHHLGSWAGWGEPE